MEEFDSYNASMTLVPQPICLQPKTQKPPKLQTHANKTDIQDPSPPLHHHPLRIPIRIKQNYYSILFLTLGKHHQQTSIPTNNPTQIGCNTQVPLACATKPVKNGATAPPALPVALTKLKLLICRLLGKSLEKTAVAQG